MQFIKLEDILSSHAAEILFIIFLLNECFFIVWFCKKGVTVCVLHNFIIDNDQQVQHCYFLKSSQAVSVQKLNNPLLGTCVADSM